MKSVHYKIEHDGTKWYYMATVDPAGMTKDEVKTVSGITNIISDFVFLVNTGKDQSKITDLIHKMISLKRAEASK
jgi:hypothetical protein